MIPTRVKSRTRKLARVLGVTSAAVARVEEWEARPEVQSGDGNQSVDAACGGDGRMIAATATALTGL